MLKLGFGLLMLAMFLRWCQDFVLANRYRHIMRLYNEKNPPTNHPQWVITYKVDRSTKVAYIDAIDEGMAVAEFIKSTRYDAIQSVNKP